MHIWQLKVQQLLGPFRRVLYVQTKSNEWIRCLIFSDKEKENYFCQTDWNLSYWKGYFVMYPTQRYFKNIKGASTRKSGRIHFRHLKMQELPGPKSRPWTSPDINLLCLLKITSLYWQNLRKKYWAPLTKCWIRHCNFLDTIRNPQRSLARYLHDDLFFWKL